MVVRKAWIPARGTYAVGSNNDPFDPTSADLSHIYTPPKDQNSTSENQEEIKGHIQAATELLNDNKELEDFLYIASMANLAPIHKADDGWKARGDPTEIAIQVFASRFDWGREKFTGGDSPLWEQVAEFPFDSDVKKMSVIFKSHKDNNVMVFTKGAVERILTSCVNVIKSNTGELSEMTEKHEQEILANMEALAAQGLRVLALASRAWEGPSGKNEQQDRSEVEQQLTFRGLIGLYDPPRPESEGAVRECHKAGIAVHMLTGDHPGTARAIAAQVGILPPNTSSLSKPMADAMVMTASQFDKLSDEQIDDLPVLPLVIARCSPATKVRMIDALHRRNCFAAMTGDGVNDSPSLKRADVGIAMGQAGSDVAKDASDIILTDDNFASILNAVEEGRRMFDNIQKFILHLLGQNIAQACTLLIGLAFKDQSGLSVFPLSPVKILWVIMVTSSAPDMGLGFESAVADIMERPPQSLKTGVFTTEVMVDMLVYGLLMAALCLASFSLVMFGFGDGNLSTGCNDSFSGCETVFRARATTFVCMTWFSLFLAWQMIDMRRSFFRMKPSSPYIFTQWARDIWANQFLFWAVMFGFVTIFPVLYIPGLNRIVFKHTGISWEWVIVVVCGILFVGGCEAWKWGKRVFFRRRAVNGLRGDLSTSVFSKYTEGSAKP
jgi:Na+-exporting ATPase